MPAEQSRNRVLVMGKPDIQSVKVSWVEKVPKTILIVFREKQFSSKLSNLEKKKSLTNINRQRINVITVLLGIFLVPKTKDWLHLRNHSCSNFPGTRAAIVFGSILPLWTNFRARFTSTEGKARHLDELSVNCPEYFFFLDMPEKTVSTNLLAFMYKAAWDVDLCYWGVLLWYGRQCVNKTADCRS